MSDPGTAPQDMDQERAFRHHLNEVNNTGLRVGSLLIGTLGLAFSVLDWFVVPEHFFLLLGIRIALAAIALIIFACTFSRRMRPLVPLMSIAVFGLAGLAINIMVHLHEGHRSGYYAGVMLVVLGAGVIMRWRLWESVTTYAFVYVTYVGPMLFEPIDAMDVFLSNNFFLVSTMLISSAGQVNGLRLLRAEFLGRMALKSAHDQLKELDQFKSQVFANITHELKTPLAMILSPLELMLYGEMGRFTTEQMATIRSMFRSALKLLKMIGDILDLSKLAESRVRLRVAEQDLVGFLEALVADARPLAGRKDIEIAFATDVATCPLWYDHERLERVFVNLLSNAAKFTPLHGHIHVQLTDGDDDVSVYVKDDGPGFPPEQAERLFERFVQADMGADRKYGGTGIGLALARELVELHGGTIRAQSAPGEGATFVVRLRKDDAHFDPAVLDTSQPATEVPAAGPASTRDQGLGNWTGALSSRDEYRLLDIAEVTERRVVVRDPDEDRRSHTVLVIEDTPDVIRVVHLALRQHFKFLAAQDGRKGLKMALKHRPDLIVTDLMMPGLDGLEVTKRLRKDERTRLIPIIMLTARGDLEDRLEGLKTGVNAYIAKPFSPRELLTTARGLLDIQEKAADRLLTGQMDSMQVITGGLTHEINNPLNYLKNAIGFLKSDTAALPGLLEAQARGELTEKDDKLLRRIEARLPKMVRTAETGIERIGKTVDLMRRYSREGFTRLPSAHDVFAATREVIELIQPSTGGNVEVESEFEGLGVIECIPEEFHQVMTNVVQNAIEACPEEGEGRVRVRGVREGDEVALTVSDNGAGMDRETRNRIFTPFFTTKGPDRGMGLGLAIVWRVIRKMGGTIRVDSEPGEGTVFRIRLPLVAPANVDGTEESTYIGESLDG